VVIGPAEVGRSAEEQSRPALGLQHRSGDDGTVGDGEPQIAARPGQQARIGAHLPGLVEIRTDPDRRAAGVMDLRRRFLIQAEAKSQVPRVAAMAPDGQR
jgi:hypothetical protein